MKRFHASTLQRFYGSRDMNTSDKRRATSHDPRPGFTRIHTALILVCLLYLPCWGEIVYHPQWLDYGDYIGPREAPGVKVYDVGAVEVGAVGLAITAEDDPSPIMIFCGDSLTTGYGGATGPWTDDVTLPTGWTRRNAAYGGWQITDMAEHALTEVDIYYNPAAQWNVLWIQGGTNDEDHVAVDVVFSRLVAFCRERQKVGWKVIVATLPSRAGTNPNGDTFKNAYNALIRARWPSFADEIADVGAYTQIGEDGDYANLTYFLEDGYHLTDAGYAYFTAAADAAVSSLVANAAKETVAQMLTIGGSTSAYPGISRFWSTPWVTFTKADGTGSGAVCDLFVATGGQSALSTGGLSVGNTSLLGFCPNAAIYEISAVANDSGISRLGAAKIAVGNGTLGDYSGTLVAGNVGIGTTAPDAKLEVNGKVRIPYNDNNGSAANYADFDVGSAGNLTITTVDGSAAAGNIVMLPDGITVIGDAGTTSHGLAANDDQLVTGQLEVNGLASFDGGAAFYANSYFGGITNVTEGSVFQYNGKSSSNLANWSASQQITIAAGSSTATTTTLSVPVRSTITGFVAKVTQAPGGGPTNFNVGIAGGDADCLIDNGAVTVNGTFDAWEDGDGTYTFFIPVPTSGGAMTFTVTTTNGSDVATNVTGASFIIRLVAFYQTRTPPTS